MKAILLAGIVASCAPDGSTVRIIGSSTVFPFSRAVAERTAYKFHTPSPVVEMTGTGGGLQLFCSRDSNINVANASRPIKPSESARCAANNVGDIIEFRIGYDGIVVAVARDNPLQALTLDQVYRAVAKDLPSANGFAPNPHRSWSDVDPALPDIAIEVHGPPPTSGTRDAFVEIALENGAKSIPELARLAKTDPDAFKARAGALREDGHWIDEGENDNAIIQLIRSSQVAIGVFGYSFYDQNRALVRGVSIDGDAPSIAGIQRGSYPLSRSLYFYVNATRADAPVARYTLEFMSESAAGEFGYLQEKGLAPLNPSDRAVEYEKARDLARRVGAL